MSNIRFQGLGLTSVINLIIWPQFSSRLSLSKSANHWQGKQFSCSFCNYLSSVFKSGKINRSVWGILLIYTFQQLYCFQMTLPDKNTHHPSVQIKLVFQPLCRYRMGSAKHLVWIKTDDITYTYYKDVERLFTHRMRLFWRKQVTSQVGQKRVWENREKRLAWGFHGGKPGWVFLHGLKFPLAPKERAPWLSHQLAQREQKEAKGMGVKLQSCQQ